MKFVKGCDIPVFIVQRRIVVAVHFARSLPTMCVDPGRFKIIIIITATDNPRTAEQHHSLLLLLFFKTRFIHSLHATHSQFFTLRDEDETHSHSIRFVLANKVRRLTTRFVAYHSISFVASPVPYASHVSFSVDLFVSRLVQCIFAEIISSST